jgi:hypothetical protein
MNQDHPAVSGAGDGDRTITGGNLPSDTNAAAAAYQQLNPHQQQQVYHYQQQQMYHHQQQQQMYHHQQQQQRRHSYPHQQQEQHQQLHPHQQQQLSPQQQQQQMYQYQQQQLYQQQLYQQHQQQLYQQKMLSERSNQSMEPMSNNLHAQTNGTFFANANTNVNAHTEVQTHTQTQGQGQTQTLPPPQSVALATSTSTNLTTSNHNTNSSSNSSREETEADWSIMCQLLLQFKAEHGHLRVPEHYQVPVLQVLLLLQVDGNKNKTTNDKDSIHSMRNLGVWVETQKTCLDAGTITLEHAELLSLIGFEWHPKVSFVQNLQEQQEPDNRNRSKRRRRQRQQQRQQQQQGSSLDDWCMEQVTKLRHAPHKPTSVVGPTVSRVEDLEYARVKVTTLLPKCLPGDKEPFLTPNGFRKYIVRTFSHAHPDLGTGFTAQLKVLVKDDNSWRVVVVACPDMVDAFQKHLKIWIKSKVRSRDYEFLLKRGIELAVELDSSTPIGGSLAEILNPQDLRLRKGLFLTISPDGQLAKAVGLNATALGGAILNVDGTVCLSVDAYKIAMAQKKGRKFVLALCLDRRADLSGLKDSSLRLPPRRRDDMPFNLDAARKAPPAANVSQGVRTPLEWIESAFAESSKLYYRVPLPAATAVPNDAVRPAIQSQATKSVAGKVQSKDAKQQTRRRKRENEPDSRVPSRVSESAAATGRRRRQEVSTVSNLANRPEQPSDDGKKLSPRIPKKIAKSRKGPQAPSLAISSANKGDSAALSESNVDKAAAFHHFQNKYKDVASVEYSRSGIVSQAVTGRMWRQHKKSQHGLSCDDNCTCVFELPYLTATVVEGKLKTERKNPQSKWKMPRILPGNKSPTGFVDSFAPKFLPMLKVEFPHESPQQLLHRLLGMWQMHLRQRNFGMHCTVKCDCSEGWSQVFREGRVGKKPPTHTTNSHATNEKMSKQGEKRKSPSASSGLPSLDSRENEDSAPRNSGRVPKKRKMPTLGSLISSLIPVQSANDDSRTDGNGLQVTNNSNRVPKKKKKPLTDSAAITSVESDLQTTGAGSLLRGLPKPEVSLGKKSKKALSARANVSGVDRPNLQTMVGHGEQNGQSGASQTSSEILRSPFPTSSIGVRNDPIVEPSPPADTWVTVDTQRAIRVEDLPKPILKDSDRGVAAGKRRVLFDVNPIKEWRFYEIDSKTTEFQVKSTELSTGVLALSARTYHHDASLRVPDSQASLSDTIRNKTFKDVLSFFKNTKDSGARSSERLNDALRVTKDSLRSIDAELASKPRDKVLCRQRRDFEFKNSFLKICINAAYTLQVARSLKNWVRFETVVTMIDEIELSAHGRLEGGENILSAEVTATYGPNPSERLMNLPSKPLSSRLEYESPHSYFMQHNVSIPPPRALMIDLRNLSENGNSSIELGSVVIPMSDLHKTCTQDGAWCALTVEASPNHFLLGAKVSIQARRVALEPHYLETKRTTQCKKVAEVASWIKRFNMNLKPDERAACQLSPRVGNFSLLDAAVYLEDDALVKMLLDIDTDKSSKRVASSALSLALNIEDGIAKKMLDDDEDEDQTADNTKELQQEWRRNRLEAIAKLLRDHMH